MAENGAETMSIVFNMKADTDEELVSQVSHLLKQLNGDVIERIMERVHEERCPHCWSPHHKDGRCQCWNDE